MRNQLIITASLAFLTACATHAPRNQPYFEQAAQADVLMQGGHPLEAAELYKKLARSHPSQQNSFNLLTAEALLQSGDHAQAQRYVDQINTNTLSIEQFNRLNLIRARIDLSMGSAESALLRLNDIQPVRLNEINRKHFYRAQAFASSLTGDLLASSRARIRLGELLVQADLIQQNNASILETLRLLPSSILFQTQAPSPDILGGWAALAYILNKNPQISALQSALGSWQIKHPYHPANGDFLTAYIQPTSFTYHQPNAIALLLPHSGPFATAANALRQGFMVAYQQDARQPSLRIYDSQSQDPVTLYQQAIAEGAELVIGPLHKDNILQLVNSVEKLSVPVLALNSIENLSKPNLFQFALSPIDDTRELAARALLDDHKNVVIMMPDNSKGRRLANYLTESWQDVEGHVLEIQYYNAKSHDFTQPIQHALNLDESTSRFKQLRRVLNRSIEFMPRRRQDIDAIFLSAYAKTARSLNPQLNFFQAGNVPVFALPDIYSGSTIPSLDSDLNNISFCDIPWMFDEIYHGSFSKAATADIWRAFSTRYHRLVAMGIDAFNLVNHLGQLAQEKYQGATGILSLNFENRIQRELACAYFNDGYVVPTGYINASAEPAAMEYEFSDEELEEAAQPIFHDIR